VWCSFLRHTVGYLGGVACAGLRNDTGHGKDDQVQRVIEGTTTQVSSCVEIRHRDSYSVDEPVRLWVRALNAEKRKPLAVLRTCATHPHRIAGCPGCVVHRP
jgi:hypothetical protein